MMTSIPYSDGWKVKRKWMGSLSKPKKHGMHSYPSQSQEITRVEFVFRQKGVILGALLHLLFLLLTSSLK